MKPILETESCLFNRGESPSLASAWCLLQFMKPLFLWTLVTYVQCPPPPHKQSRWDSRLIKSHSNWLFGTNRYNPAGCCQGGFAVCQQTTTKIWMDPSIMGRATLFYCPQFFSRCFNIFCSCVLHRQPAKQRLTSRGDFSKCIWLLYWNKKGNQNSNSNGNTSPELVMKWEA